MNVFDSLILEHNLVISDHFQSNGTIIMNLARACNRAVKAGGKIIAFGNGGSASDAQHFIAELMVKYDDPRDPITAICLNSDVAIITACANDFGYDQVFRRQLEGILNDEDIVIAISTSGTSDNITQALEYCDAVQPAGTYLLSSDKLNSGHINNRLAQVIKVPSTKTARVQEAHITTLHMIVDLMQQGV